MAKGSAAWTAEPRSPAQKLRCNIQNTQGAPEDTHPDALAAHKLAIAEERIAELKERLNEMKRERDRAQAGEDAWKAQCEVVTRQLALPAPTNAQAVLVAGVNRLPNLTPDRRPILTLLSDG